MDTNQTHFKETEKVRQAKFLSAYRDLAIYYAGRVGRFPTGTIHENIDELARNIVEGKIVL